MNIKRGVSENLPGFVKWFSELNKKSGSVAGGKGANLAEIYNMGILVPPGFVITAQAYDYFIKASGLNDKIKNLLGKINYENTEKLDEITKEIRGLIESGKFPEEMREEILEAYEILGAEDSNLKDKPAHYIIKKTPAPVFVAVRSSATTEDLAEASFAGQQETFLNVKGNDDLLKFVKKCFASLFTPRATYYRNKKGFKHEDASLAVVIQRMVDSDKSGVIFSKDPSMKREDVIIEAVWGLGEGIVSGKISPDRYIVSPDGSQILEKEIGNKRIAITKDAAGGQQVVKLKEERAKQQVLKDNETTRLAEIALRLEAHYQKPQDIEFAIERNEIYIVQTRPITTLGKRFSSENLKELKGEIILSGLAASPGIGVGKIKIVHGMEDLKKVNQGDVLVTEMTNPDMVVTMQRSSAIVTDEGGLTAHAAIVSREMGIPAVVGTQDATRKLKEGEIITVDGFTGKIYKGKVSESVQKEIRPVVSRTKTNLKVILDLPSFAPRAARTKLRGIGLARLEGIIAESGKHPNYFLKKGKIRDYEEMIFRGIKKISDFFDDIWVRTSDIRSDEFQNLEGSPEKVEANPMLGMHGIRFSLKNPEILRAELNAMKRVSEDKRGKSIGVLTPQVISLEEVKELKEILKEIDFKNAKIGVMIETPASVQIIKEICEEGIDFVSFGTNDLTQYTLAVDRGNEQVQGLYDDLHPSVLAQIAYVIKICKENNVETSICGQAGSKKEMVKFLVEHGIDSISVNADVAADIAEYIVELEKGISPRERVEELGESEGEGTGDSVEEDLSEESKGYVAQDYTDSDDELPVIPGTEYTKIEEQEEETSLNDEELENRPGLVNLKEEGEKTRLSVSELKEKRPSVVDLKEETLDIF
ncbi:MAG TPA: phosphoenolpyruvate synthase [Candidatus Nanoarchaeia archaeon]|nr:phosphoenolpyruvate synthase [Candidatus Nanoarchaeia archaeon]